MMLDLMDLMPLMLNILFLSIPEGLFAVTLSLILSRKTDLVTASKENILKLLTPSVVMAVLTNVLRGIAGYNMILMPFISVMAVWTSMILVYKFYKPVEMIKCLICVIFSVVAVGLIQFAFVPAIIYGTSVTMDDLNKPGLMTIIYSIPERLIEASIITLVLLKKRSFVRFIPIRVITKSKTLTSLSLVMVFINLIYVYVMTKSIYFDKILLGLSLQMQLLVVVAVIGFPIANITALIASIHAFVFKERKMERYIYDEARVLRVIVNNLLKERKYNEIDKRLKDFEEIVKVK